MGGIVSRTYIQSEDYEENRNDVRRFAMVGTPNQGSVLPYYIYEGGDPIGADAVTGANKIYHPNRYFYTDALNKFPIKTRSTSSPIPWEGNRNSNLHAIIHGTFINPTILDILFLCTGNLAMRFCSSLFLEFYFFQCLPRKESKTMKYQKNLK